MGTQSLVLVLGFFDVLLLIAGGVLLVVLLQGRKAARDQELAELREKVRELGSYEGYTRARIQRERELEDVARLLELTAVDNLDALGRVAPERVKAVFRKCAPHLFFKNSAEVE